MLLSITLIIITVSRHARSRSSAVTRIADLRIFLHDENDKQFRFMKFNPKLIVTIEL